MKKKERFSKDTKKILSQTKRDWYLTHNSPMKRKRKMTKRKCRICGQEVSYRLDGNFHAEIVHYARNVKTGKRVIIK